MPDGMTPPPPTPTPQSPLSPNDLAEAVRATAMLADVTLSVWSAERSDKRLMDQVKRDNGASGNAGRLVKNLLAGADDKLRETKSAFAGVRAQHYALTLPWIADPRAERVRGPRLLPNMLFDRYLNEMSLRKRAAMAALDDFVMHYPDLVIQAKINLGAMADSSDYPDASEVRAAFKVSFDFEPIPAAAAFRGLPDAMLDRLGRNLAARQARMIGSATAAMWREVRGRVGHVVDRLADTEVQFRTSTIEGARELGGLIPAWNLALDPRADEIARDISRMLEGVDAVALRKNEPLRRDVLEQAQGVIAKLDAWEV